MPRLTNTAGAIVEVPEEKVARLGSAWTRIDGSKPAPAAPTGWDARKVDELREEIERRNEGREGDDVISLEGKKADLVDALTADDARTADPSA